MDEQGCEWAAGPSAINKDQNLFLASVVALVLRCGRFLMGRQVLQWWSVHGENHHQQDASRLTLFPSPSQYFGASPPCDLAYSLFPAGLLKQSGASLFFSPSCFLLSLFSLFLLQPNSFFLSSTRATLFLADFTLPYHHSLHCFSRCLSQLHHFLYHTPHLQWPPT